jgi:hypothetical protein
MMRALSYGMVALFALTACGSTLEEDGVRQFTLSGQIGESEGLVLGTGEVVDTYFGEIGESDIYLSMKMSMVLTGPTGDPSFCPKGTDFASVDDVPAEPTGCVWGSASLAGNAPFEDSDRLVTGQGYLVEDRAGDLYRLRIVEHSIDESHIGTVTFDVLAAD